MVVIQHLEKCRIEVGEVFLDRPAIQFLARKSDHIDSKVAIRRLGEVLGHPGRALPAVGKQDDLLARIRVQLKCRPIV